MQLSDKDRLEIGRRVTQARKTAGLSSADVARALGITRSSVSKWESGDAAPNIKSVFMLQELTGHNAKWLATGMGPPRTNTAEFTSLVRGLDHDHLLDVLRLVTQQLSEQQK